MEADDNAATFAGNWNTSRAILLWYGDDYEVAQGGGSADTATFRSPTPIATTGLWCIHARWTAFPNRFDNARFEIYDGVIGEAGTSLVGTFFVSMQSNGGAWRRLGCAPLRRNQFSEVRLSDFGAAAGQFVVADGVRWVFLQLDTVFITDEPGVDSGAPGQVQIGGGFPIGTCNPFLGVTTFTDLRAVNITAPTSGQVIVRASGQVALSVADRFVRVGIDNASGGSTIDTIPWEAAVPTGSTSGPTNRRSFTIQHELRLPRATRGHPRRIGVTTSTVETTSTVSARSSISPRAATSPSCPT